MIQLNLTFDRTSRGIFLVVVLALVAVACSNKKLNQENADKAIREFISSHPLNPIPGTEWFHPPCSFQLESIAEIGPVSQFTESEASATLRLKCGEDGLPMKFVFHRNVDNKWILTNLATLPDYHYNGGMTDTIRFYGNINIVAQ